MHKQFFISLLANLLSLKDKGVVVDEDNKKDVHKGILECDRKLHKYKKLLDEFFESREGYNNKMLQDFLDEKMHPHKHTEDGIKYYLEWYARMHLGKKIYDCINENGVCSFEAEL